MPPSTDEERLSWPERFKAASLSLGFVLILGFLGWLLWTYIPILNPLDWIGQRFWEPMPEAGLLRFVPVGIAMLFMLACYLVLLPLGFLTFAAGVVQGLRGRRTRLVAWILRDMSHQEVRKHHEQMPQSAEAEGGFSRGQKAVNSYLHPAVGWGILIGFLVLAVAVLVWSGTWR